MSRSQAGTPYFEKFIAAALLAMSLLALGACNTTSTHAMFSGAQADEPYLRPHMKVQAREPITQLAMAENPRMQAYRPVKVLAYSATPRNVQDIEPAAGNVGAEISKAPRDKVDQAEKPYRAAAYHPNAPVPNVASTGQYNFTYSQDPEELETALALNGCDVGGNGGIVSYQWGSNSLGLRGSKGLKLQFTMEFQPKEQEKRCNVKKGWSGLMGERFDRMFSEK